MEPYSVLMTLYNKEVAAYFQASVESMLAQTVRPDEFILVCDGPLTPALSAAVNAFEAAYPGFFHVVRLAQNQGTGRANNIGLACCCNDLVARMDSDDLSVPERCQIELSVFEEQPTLAIVGGDISEFEETPERPFAVRRVPRTYADILSTARRRMPFNNPTIMFRRSAVFAAGGYSSMRRCEDYELLARMLAGGAAARNVDQILLHYRLSRKAMDRRGTWLNLKSFVGARWRMLCSGFSSPLDFLNPCMCQIVYTLLPHPIQLRVYRELLRK